MHEGGYGYAPFELWNIGKCSRCDQRCERRVGLRRSRRNGRGGREALYFIIDEEPVALCAHLTEVCKNSRCRFCWHCWNIPGQMVSREELRKRIWPADTFVDFDRGPYSALARLRDALGDSAENPRYIETIPRKGYRFIAPVEVPLPAQTEGPANLAPALPEETTPGESRTVAPRIGRRLSIVLVSVMIVAGLLAAFGSRVVRRGRSSRVEAGQIRSLAVLPLENVSGDATQDFLAEGMTEELITELGKSNSLRVISRTSVMQYKGTKKPVQAIARELSVDAVLEGTVARSGNHVRITPNLVQSSPETHLWAESYDSENGDILSVQQRVADSVAREIRVALSPRDTATSRDGRRVNRVLSASLRDLR